MTYLLALVVLGLIILVVALYSKVSSLEDKLNESLESTKKHVKKYNDFIVDSSEHRDMLQGRISKLESRINKMTKTNR